MKLHLLLGEEDEVSVEYAGEGATVKYRPGVHTTEFVEKMDTVSLDEGLAQLAITTGVEDDEGAPVPSTPEGWRQLPTRYKRTVLKAILEDQRPNSKTDGPSDTSF